MFGSLLEMKDEGEYARGNSGQNFVANFEVSIACMAGARKGKGKGKARARGAGGARRHSPRFARAFLLALATQANVRTEMGNTNLQPEEPRNYMLFKFFFQTLYFVSCTRFQNTCPIFHFRFHLSLHFKARLGAKSLLCKSVFIQIEIRTNYHNKKFDSL